MGREEEQRLQELQEDIERQREDVGDAESVLENERQFYESGDEGPVDDAIAPPG